MTNHSPLDAPCQVCGVGIGEMCIVTASLAKYSLGTFREGESLGTPHRRRKYFYTNVDYSQPDWLQQLIDEDKEWDRLEAIQKWNAQFKKED